MTEDKKSDLDSVQGDDDTVAASPDTTELLDEASQLLQDSDAENAVVTVADYHDMIQADSTTEGEAASTLRENEMLRNAVADLSLRLKRIWGAVVIQGALLVFIIIGVVFVYPKYRYIPTVDNMAVCEVGTETNPRVTPEVLAEFAKDAVIDLYTYSFVDWREKINSSINRWMSDDGRMGFLTGLESSGNLERIRKQRLILKTMSINVPQLEDAGFDGVTRFWIVRVPIVMEFYQNLSDKPIARQNYIAAAKLITVPPTAQRVKGIAVKQVVLAHSSAQQ